MHLITAWRASEDEYKNGCRHGVIEVTNSARTDDLLAIRIHEYRSSSGMTLGDDITISGLTPEEVIQMGEDLIAEARRLKPEPTGLARAYAQVALDIARATSFPMYAAYDPETETFTRETAMSIAAAQRLGYVVVDEYLTADEFHMGWAGLHDSQNATVEDVLAAFPVDDDFLRERIASARLQPAN